MRKYCRKLIMPFASAWSFLHNLIPAGSFWREILTNVRENGILIAGVRKKTDSPQAARHLPEGAGSLPEVPEGAGSA